MPRAGARYGSAIVAWAASRIAATRPNVVFRKVGSDRTPYENDLRRLRVLVMVPALRLAEVLSLRELRSYLTVPFVLCWSPLKTPSSWTWSEADDSTVQGGSTPGSRHRAHTRACRARLADGTSSLMCFVSQGEAVSTRSWVPI